MKPYVTLPFLMLLLAPSAWAKETCKYPLEKLSSKLVPAGGAQTVKPITLGEGDPQTLEHSIRLPSGALLSYSSNGCEYFNSTLSFRHLGAMPKPGDPHLFERLRAELAAAPLGGRAEPDDAPAMLAALEKAAKTPDKWQTPSEVYPEYDRLVALATATGKLPDGEAERRGGSWPKKTAIFTEYKDDASVSLDVLPDGFDLDYTQSFEQ